MPYSAHIDTFNGDNLPPLNSRSSSTPELKFPR